MTRKGVKIAMVLSVSALILSVTLETRYIAIPNTDLLGTVLYSRASNLVTSLEEQDSDTQSISEAITETPKTNEVEEQEVSLSQVTQTHVLLEQKCPFVPSDTNVVFYLQNEEQKPMHVPEGHYTIELAGERKKALHSEKEDYGGWYVTLTKETDDTVLTSGIARNVYDDERMVVELVEGVLALEKGDYFMQPQYEGDASKQDVQPLCALLKTEVVDPALFPVIETRVLNTTDSFEERFEEKMNTSIDSFEEKFEETQETMTTTYEESAENFETSLFKHSTPTSPYIATETEPVVTHETYTTGDNNQIYVEVSTYSIGVTGSEENISILKDTAEKRKSILDDLKEESLFELLQEKQEYVRNVKLPELITTRSDVFGTIEEHIDLTRTSIEQNLTGIEAVHTDTKEALETFRYNKREAFESKIDSDGDGVTDYDEEFIYQSDPYNPFTSGSVLTDGERILLGLDPKKDDFRVLPIESAKQKVGPISERFQVHTIQYTLNDESEKGIQIEGSADPYSFVTLYVYSTPVIITVRADENGSFTYTLDNHLEDGTHELYVATVNSTGKILAQSKAHAFIKTAEAITYTPANVSNIEGPVDDALQKLVAISLLLTLLCAIGITVAIGYMKGKNHEHNKLENESHEIRED